MKGMLFVIVYTLVILSGCTQSTQIEGNKTNISEPAAPPPALPNQTVPQPHNATVNASTDVTTNGTEMDIPAAYDPKISPSDFSSAVTNRFFSLQPGKRMVYEGQTEDGTERIETYVMDQTRMVDGVETIVVWDRVWLDGDLIEETFDWYAQDELGNVWYFGEDSKEMIGGQVVSTAGSWETGIDGAKPGIIMEADPAIGDSYKQEYYEGEAEDMADVLSVNESVSVPAGNFSGCLKTLDWSPLEPDLLEHKYYCAEVGGVVLEVGLEDGERVELISVDYGSVPSPSTQEPPEVLKTNITEEEAELIALEEVPGEVTDIAIEKKHGKVVYVVEVDADSGPETDVIIDIETGEVLAIET